LSSLGHAVTDPFHVAVNYRPAQKSFKTLSSNFLVKISLGTLHILLLDPCYKFL
jgi:hypothetical protein